MKRLLIAMVVMVASTTVLAQGVSRPSVRSRRPANVHEANRCSARIVRVLGLDNDYFRDTELFKSGQASTYSTEVVLNEPFGPFNKARCSLMTRTPSVVDVTTDDRSNATNALPRYFMERVTLTREYDRETTAEDLEGELKKVVDQLNGIFGCQLVSPILSPVDDEDKRQDESKSGSHRQLRRRRMGAVFGVVPPLSVYIGLKGQQINIAAYEPVFCKRDGIVKLKMPAMMSMTIYMDQQLEMNHGLDDGDVEVKPVVLGADNVKAFSGAFSQTKGVNFGHSRSPAKYEYNRDTKRIVRGLDVDGSLAEDSLRREREEQRKQLLQVQKELRKARMERGKQVNSEKESPANAGSTTNNATNKLVQSKNVVAEKLQSCDFLLNKDFKKSAKFYLCLFSASWCGPCRREMPRIAQTYVDTLKDDPDIELIHFSRDRDDEKALDWAKEHDVKFPVVKPKGGNPLDLHTRGIPHLFIVKADGTLMEEGHPMRIFNEEKFQELKGGPLSGSAKSQDAGGEYKIVSKTNELFTLSGPYGIRMVADPGCEKGTEYVMKKLVNVYLPRAKEYYGDPFQGKNPSRVYTIDVSMNDGLGNSDYTGPSYGPGTGSWRIGLAKGAERYEMSLDYLASSVLTICEEPKWASFVFYVNRLAEGKVRHIDPTPRLKEDIRRGLEQSDDKKNNWYRSHAPMWAALEELREKHPTFILEYCNLKNSRYAEGKLPGRISLKQMADLLGEVTGEDVVALFQKYNIREK